MKGTQAGWGKRVPAGDRPEGELYPLLVGTRGLKIPRLTACGRVEPWVPEAGGREWPYSVIDFGKASRLAASGRV